MGYSKEEILDYLHKFEMGWENPAKYVSSDFWLDVQNLIKFLDSKNNSSVSESVSLISDILDGKDIRTAITEKSQGAFSVNEARKFVVGDTFSFKDKYGEAHDCKVTKREDFDEADWDDYAIGTITFTYPTMGEPKTKTVRIYKSEQSDSYGDEYFVSDTEKLKNGFGIASWVFPNRR